MNRKPADKTFAYLLGCYFGDASVFKRNGSYAYSFECIDIEFISKVATILSSWTGRNVNIHKRKDNNKYYLQITSKDFEVFVKDTGGCRYIPSYVFNWDKDLQKEFLEGVLDSDGWISRRENPNGNVHFQMGYGTTYSWTCDIKRLLQSFGVVCHKLREIPTKNKIQLSFIINIASFISSGLKFNVKRKQTKVNDYCDRRMKSQRLYDYTEKV